VTQKVLQERRGDLELVEAAMPLQDMITWGIEDHGCKVMLGGGDIKEIVSKVFRPLVLSVKHLSLDDCLVIKCLEDNFAFPENSNSFNGYNDTAESENFHTNTIYYD
jgi:hypothetical protein